MIGTHRLRDARTSTSLGPFRIVLLLTQVPVGLGDEWRRFKIARNATEFSVPFPFFRTPSQSRLGVIKRLTFLSALKRP